MRFITWNLVLAAWLLVSAFALGHSPASAAVTFISGLAIGFLALASGGRPGLRYFITAIALVLAGSALLLVDASGLARVSTAVVAAIIFALSLVSPRHAGETAPRAGAAHGA